MSFVSTLLRRPERWDNWRQVEPIRDGRECPECLAVVYGCRSRRDHRAWHIMRTEFDTQILAGLRKLAKAAGLNVVIVEPEEMPEGEYDALELDRRLTVKARAVAAAGYDDEGDDDE